MRERAQFAPVCRRCPNGLTGCPPRVPGVWVSPHVRQGILAKASYQAQEGDHRAEPVDQEREALP